jgi:hypothetical protein
VPPVLRHIARARQGAEDSRLSELRFELGAF